MAFDFGIGSNYSSNLFDSMFGGTSSGSSNILGDYAAIKNGSYKTLLKSYYAETKASEGSGTDEEDTKVKDEKKNLTLAKNDAEGLMKAASDLFNTEFDMSVEGVEKEIDSEDVIKKIKSFVEAYNKVIDSGAEVDNKSVLSKTLQMTQNMKSNKASLAKVGITIGFDNKLSFDEKNFDNVNKSALNSVFNGRNSVVANVGNKASQLFNLAGAATFEKAAGSAYTRSGQYNPSSAFSMFNAMF